MKINDRYEIIRDKYNFIVEETIPIDPTHKYATGKNTSKKGRSYFPTLEMACLNILKTTPDIESLETVIASIEKATADITAAIKVARD